MPGPPPPSKSYNIKIIDSSDEEEEEDDNEEDYYSYREDPARRRLQSSRNQDEDEAMLVDEGIISGSLDNRTTTKKDDNAGEIKNSISEDNDAASPPKKKKKKKKKRKKKKKKRSTSSDDADFNSTSIDGDEEEGDEDGSTDDEHADNNEHDGTANAKGNARKIKGVRFDSVHIHSFERCLGRDVVPYDGGWPLGLGDAVTLDDDCNQNKHGKSRNSKFRADISVPLNDYEESKQQRLRLRAHDKGISFDTPKKSECVENNTIIRELETRQWDYRVGPKNPLFHLLTEDQRMVLLLESSTPDDNNAMEDNSGGSHHDTAVPFKKRNSKGSSSPSSKGSPSKHHDHSDSHRNSHHVQTRSRSNSHGQQHTNNHRRERSGSITEQYNDVYTQVDVHHVRHELEELRFARTGVGHTGCTCRKLDVYLLPPGGGGKKAHHRRMQVRRVKEELKKRHLLPTETKTREELELLLHDTVEKEACCINADCPCVRNGIECQADVCDCWHDSHQTKEQKHQHHLAADFVVKDVQDRCGNPNGMYAVDLAAIHAMRQRILQAYLDSGSDSNDQFCNVVCPPISPHTPLPLSVTSTDKQR